MTRVTWGPWESKHIATVVKCISSRELSENSIKFFLSNTDKGAVGLIPALELASLTVDSIPKILHYSWNSLAEYCTSLSEIIYRGSLCNG